MFSMFFGAGNVVFPLALGQIAQDQNPYAILGMLITAVGVPFAGLMAMTLFHGDYNSFFGRIGKIPGLLLSAIIMGLIGPFGAIPRCIALSYSTAQMFLPHISLPIFSLISCLIIWLFTFRRNTIINTLGYFLTPLLLASLLIIIIKGIISSPAAPIADHSRFTMFLTGLKDGYQTMDLLGAFFFSSVIIVCLKEEIEASHPGDYKKLTLTTLKASCIGAFLLAAIYVGFSFVSSYYSESLQGITPDLLISRISVEVLGSKAAVIACLAVALACLTTAIALSSVFAEFIVEDISLNKIGYQTALLLTLGITFFVSTLNFTGIANFLTPVLQICYPALIALTVLNICNKLFGFKPIKVPVLVVFLLTLVFYFYPF